MSDFKYVPGGQSSQPLQQSQQPQIPQVKINPKDLKDYVCPNCNSYTFNQIFVLKTVNPLTVGLPPGEERALPVAIGFQCTECGTIPEKFGGKLLEEMKKRTDEEKKPE